MSAFKKLDRRDVFTTVHLATKSYSENTDSPTYGVEFTKGVSGSIPIFSGNSNFVQEAKYSSIRQLYYSNNSDYYNYDTGSFDNYLQSTLALSGSRNILSKVAVISYPRSSYGEALKPNTVTLDLGSLGEYILDEGDYVLETALAGGEYIISSGQTGVVKDDGEGRLVITSGSVDGSTVGDVVGDIVYPHGIAVITTENLVETFSSPTSFDLSWKGLYSVYTLNFKCKVRDEELNYSLNPTAIKDIDGNISNNLSGSEFRPYVTSVGLYNDSNELIAVAKLSQPIPKTTDTDMTFQVKLDI